jgi:hypothetical protein
MTLLAMRPDGQKPGMSVMLLFPHCRQLQVLRGCIAKVKPGRPAYQQIDDCVFAPKHTLAG